MLGISTTNVRVGGFRGKGIDADATTIYNRIIADGGVSNLTRLNFFVKGLKTIYGSLTNVPVCYDAHWIGYKLGSGTGATSGQAAAKLYSLTVAGDAVQSTAASQPLLLSHNGASTDNYWWGSGVAGNYCSTPNAAANQITGDIELTAKFRINSLSNAGIILSKWSSNANNTGSYELFYSGGSRFQFYIQRASDGLANNVLSGVFSLTINTDIYIKVNRIASTGTVNFYQSTDGITYNLISTSTLFTGENIYNSTALVKIGSEFAVDQSNINAKISRATASNSIGGAPVVDFNPATYNASTSQTAWTSSTGEVWTINTGTADTGLAGKLVDRTVIMGNGTTFTLSAVSPSFTRKQLTWIVAANQSNAAYASFIKINKSTDTNSGTMRILNATSMYNTTSDAFSLLGGSTVDGVSTVTIVRNKLHVLKGLNSLMGGGTVARIDILDDNPNVRFIRGVVNTVVHTSNTDDISAFLRTLNNL
jgi:hypothetical protein